MAHRMSQPSCHKSLSIAVDMDSFALSSLIPGLGDVDHWIELLQLLPVIIVLELVLSADNAIALAAISKAQKRIDLQSKALNLGITLAFVLRILLILFAKLLLDFWLMQLVAGIFLLYLFINHLYDQSLELPLEENIDNNRVSAPIPFYRTVLLLALTDLAFSVDSVSAAIAVSDQLILVITGATIGVIALRFSSELFIRWLKVYPRLETAGYLAVAFVGIKLLLAIVMPFLDVPNWFTLITVSVFFTWGFSSRSMTVEDQF